MSAKMSANDISTAEIAQSDQYYQHYKLPQQQQQQQPQPCIRHHLNNQHQQQHQQLTTTPHSNNNNSIHWQQQNNPSMDVTTTTTTVPTRPSELDFYYYQQQQQQQPNIAQITKQKAANNAVMLMCNNQQHNQQQQLEQTARTFITPIDIPTPPPQPAAAAAATAATTNNIIASNNIGNNKRVQLLHQNSLGRQSQQQQQQQQQQRHCHCKHGAMLQDYNNMQQQTKATVNNSTTVVANTVSTTAAAVIALAANQQSPHPQQRSTLSLGNSMSSHSHDFYETHLTPPPPPPPLGHIPTQQQQQQQHQQQLISDHYRKNPHPHSHHTHQHQHQHQHYRSQDHLQHLLPSVNNSKKGGGGGVGGGVGGSGGITGCTLTSHAAGINMDGRRFKNLVYSQQKIRRIRWILGISFGLVCLAALGTAIYFIARSAGEDMGPNKPNTGNNGINLDDLLTGQLAAKRFNASWSAGSNLIYKEANAIVEFDVKTQQKRTLLYGDHQYVLFEKSADGELLLLAKKYKKNFRHSFEAEYDIYNISSKQIQPLVIGGEQRFLLMAQWAPVGNALILNYERNLYYKPHAFAQEIAITRDNQAGVLNGIPDWVYEEEVFSSNTATWFSPDGKMIAFIRFDDTPTNVINFPYYGEAGDLRYQYPYNRLVAYPKAGSSNPHVKLFTADLTRAAEGLDALTEIPRPSELNTETDDIITVVHWLDKKKVLSVWMNRIQNLAYLQVFDGLGRTVIHSLESKTGWVDLFAAPFHNRDGTRIALILPQAQGNDGNFRHLCTLPTTSANSKPEVLTKGKFVVQSILHWDPSSDVIFYTANTPQNPEVLHVYAIKATTGQTPKCLTCDLQMDGAVAQNYYTATFNADHQVVISSLGPAAPMHAIYEWSWSNNEVKLTKLIDWEHNNQLRSKLKNLAMPTIEIHNVPLEGGFTAKVLLQLPPNLDRSGKTKYPMLIDVYGGPDSYSVVNKWILDWGTYLSSNQSVIYAKIDGRGSGLRGDKLLHSVYLKLGTVEIADQINVARYLQEHFNYIDPKHTGIWGWSYGGYAAAMALANDNSSVFSCAASIAPVTDWAYYDSIYTERYMSLPSLNEVGYAKGRLSTRAEKLDGKKFLLVHGTLDDNVHYQQAMILAKNLERNDILFKQISYPDEDHGLAGVRPHLYHSLDRFFGECFASKRLMGIK